MIDPALATTRRFLHGAAELLLAGPQHRTIGRIELRVVDGGFATIGEPAVRVEGDELLTESARVALNGLTYHQAAAKAGLTAGAPANVYTDGPGVDPSETIVLEPAALATLMAAFVVGDKALREFAPSETPTLWPEHFDVAIRLDNVNYGVSPGDGYLPEPYAYVGPNETPAGEFWNAPFGAARPVSEFGGYEAVVSSFRAGQAALAS